MPRAAKIWWNKQKQAWCTDLGGRRATLAQGRKNRTQAIDRLKALLAERELLSTVGGSITVARLCEEFLVDTQENREPATYESYKYACQKFVNLFGGRDAHSIGPLDITAFDRTLKTTLNNTSRGIVLRSVERCLNWGVEMRLIPPHNLGRIRKPQANVRDRFVTDQEFQLLLRSTNAKNGRRCGASFRRLLLAFEWTGCRPGELARLEWSHLRWDQSVAILTHHKTKRTGKPRIIPLVPKLKRLLLWMKSRTTSRYCFTNSLGQPWTVKAIQKRMASIREKSGLMDVVPYTMRHRAGTNAFCRTKDIKSTGNLLGQSTLAITERYVHLAQEHLVEFAERAIG